jgi:hypothetical protein
MEPPSEFTPYLILAGVLLVPALVFLVGFLLIRTRRSKFRHQRSNHRQGR